MSPFGDAKGTDELMHCHRDCLLLYGTWEIYTKHSYCFLQISIAIWSFFVYVEVALTMLHPAWHTCNYSSRHYKIGNSFMAPDTKRLIYRRFQSRLTIAISLPTNNAEY